tara:strand:+ start:148 stop:324 length:177 start_codon:yes stop_codon:yes gene_type:complete
MELISASEAHTRTTDSRKKIVAVGKRTAMQVVNDAITIGKYRTTVSLDGFLINGMISF